jgi:cytochrome c oxidase cbb3-type subunit 3
MAGDANQGEKLFDANCAACHQPGGVGKPGLAPSIRNREYLALASDEFIRLTVKHGRPGTAMVPRPDLDGEKVAHIITYLRALPVAHPVEITVRPNLRLGGDATVGAEKYTQYCSSCHGAKGQGYSAGGSGPGIGLPGFLDVASDDYILQTVKYGRIGTAMMPFIGSAGLANLQEPDVGDIIAHLRSLHPKSTDE